MGAGVEEGCYWAGVGDPEVVGSVAGIYTSLPVSSVRGFLEVQSGKPTTNRMSLPKAAVAFNGVSLSTIDELQLTSSFSRQKHWTAKRASFFYSVHALNMKRCGVSGGRDGRV